MSAVPGPGLDQLRRHAIARSLFAPTTLGRAIQRLGFVQADPIRAPARAQDLTLRHRVRDYRAGDLERRYRSLPIEEDFFVNYGFVTRALHRQMHPRLARQSWTAQRASQARDILAFVREHGEVHPRAVDQAFAHGKARNGFGGASNASTQLLDEMHYRGMLRVARRDGGTRCYAVRNDSATVDTSAASEALDRPAPDPASILDSLLDLAVAKYAPLPARTLGWLASALTRHAVPQWQSDRGAALARARTRLARAGIDGQDWYWPADERLPRRDSEVDETVRLLAPFDPVVWDRLRFEQFWGWSYRFEAYTPAQRRVRGYYALPLLWRDQVIGWGNLSWRDGKLDAELGYVRGRQPRDAAYRRALEAELARMQAFLAPRGDRQIGAR